MSRRHANMQATSETPLAQLPWMLVRTWLRSELNCREHGDCYSEHLKTCRIVWKLAWCRPAHWVSLSSWVCSHNPYDMVRFPFHSMVKLLIRLDWIRIGEVFSHFSPLLISKFWLPYWCMLLRFCGQWIKAKNVGLQLKSFCSFHAGEEDNLFQGINSYRTSLNLTALTKNDNAECLAEKLADQFKDQPCTNTTGANTIPGTENQLPNFPTLLEKCHLNVTNTRDGEIMPACVPNLVPSLVLSNYTQSALYSGSLNNTKYTGIGIGSEKNWIVAILTTSTPEGGYAPASSDNAASPSSRITFSFRLFFLLWGSFLFALSWTLVVPMRRTNPYEKSAR